MQPRRLVDVSLGDIGLRELALGVVAGGAVLALQDLLAVLVKLDLGDDDLGGVDAHGHRGAVGLLAHHTLDVDDELLTVARRDAALAVLERAAHNRDLVVLADRQRAHL